MIIITPRSPASGGTKYEHERDIDRSEDDPDAIDRLQNSIDHSCSPDAEADGPQAAELPDEQSALCIGLGKILGWINSVSQKRGRTIARSKEIRIQAVLYHFGIKNQVELAREIGVTKAAISQQAVEFKSHFNLIRTYGAAQQMRSDQAREKFSKVCTNSHKLRKASSESSESQRTLTQNLPKPLSLRERVLEAAKQQ